MGYIHEYTLVVYIILELSTSLLFQLSNLTIYEKVGKTIGIVLIETKYLQTLKHFDDYY